MNPKVKLANQGEKPPMSELVKGLIIFINSSAPPTEANR